MKSEKTLIIKRASILAIGTLSSRILGLVRDIILAAFFDRTITDAWLTAFKLPNLFRRLFGEGALSLNFIPIFLKERKKNILNAKKFSKEVLSLIHIILLPLMVVSVIFMEDILRFILQENYLSDSKKFALTIYMAKIMFFYVYLVIMYAFYTAILQSIGKFALSAFAPTIFNLIFIIAAILSPPDTVSQSTYLSIGVIVAGIMQLIILVPTIYQD